MGTAVRAAGFYNMQMLPHLNERMREFISRMELMFVATADGRGECDCSLRAGSPGFVQVTGPTGLAWPEYSGNGVFASLGNISENAHVGLLFVDFFESTIGLHVNGRARCVAAGALALEPLGRQVRLDPRARHWVVVEVEEAFIHCSKHVPLLSKRPKEIEWSTEDGRRKGGDYFGVRDLPRPWEEAPPVAAILEALKASNGER